MRTIHLKGTKITVYDSIDEMPIKRFDEFNKALLIDANVGSSVYDLDKRFQTMFNFLEAGDNDNALKEHSNLRIAFHNASIGNNTRADAFASLIYSFNGFKVGSVEMTNEDVMDKLVELGITQGMIMEVVEEVKKNWIQKLG